MKKIYFDNAASTRVDAIFVNTLEKVVQEYYANPSANNSEGYEAKKLFLSAKEQIKEVCKFDGEIIFTSGASESINTVIKGLVNQTCKNNIIVTSKYEHPAVLNTLAFVEKFHGIEIKYLELSDLQSNLVEFEKTMQQKPLLLTITHVNSEVGYLLPIAKMCEIAKKYGVLTHVDAAQSFGKMAIDFTNIDFLSVSMHKIHGFNGTGLLFCQNSALLEPLIHGGNQQSIRSGTLDVAMAVCSSKTTRISYEKMLENFKYVKKLNNYMRQRLSSVPGIVINSFEGGSPYILNISSTKIEARLLTRLLMERGVFLSTQTACKSDSDISALVYELFLDEKRALNTMRVSFSKYSTLAEIDEFILILTDIIENGE